MIYFFYGENSFAINRTRDEILHDFEKNFGENSIEKIAFDDENFLDKIREIFNVNLFFKKRLFLFENPEKNPENWREIGENLARFSEAENEILIIAENPDKRTKTFKDLLKIAGKNAREFRKKSPRETIIFTENLARELGFSVQKNAAEKLANFCAFDEWRIFSELKKMREISTDLSENLIEKFVTPDLSANAFLILDLAISGEKMHAKNELEKLRANREEAMKFFGLLASQIFALSAAAAEKNPKFSDYKIAPFQLQKARESWHKISQKTGNLTKNPREIIANLTRKLAETDAKMKRSNQEQSWLYLEIFLGEI